jgi:hypothetical protein
MLTALPLAAQDMVRPVSPSRLQVAEVIHAQSYFERNDGQIDGQVLYEAHGLEYSAFLTREGATLVLPTVQPAGQTSTRDNRHVVRLSFQGMNPRSRLDGLETLPGYSSYFSGSDPKQWHTRVPHFVRVRYRAIYPGIDLIFYMRDGRLEYDFAASPGAETGAIRMKVEGAVAKLTSGGDVVLQDGGRELIRLKKPRAEQADADGQPIQAGYSVHGHEVGLALGQYNHSRALLIDPALVFSTFLTSNIANCSSCDTLGDIAADNSGIYVTGGTRSNTFPFKTGDPQPVQQADSFTFVTKLDPSGSTIIYKAFLAQSSGVSLAVDSSGAAYVAGLVGYSSTASRFPTTAGTFSPTSPMCVPDLHNGSGCLVSYAAKLSSDGASLLYSTFLQTSSGPVPLPNSGMGGELVGPIKVAVDANGGLYIAGSNAVGQDICCSNALPLQVTLGAFQTTRGTLFALKLNSSGTTLDYATYLDANAALGNPPRSVFIAVDSTNAAYIAGTAGPGYPTTPGALVTSISSGEAGFVTKLSTNGQSQVYSTYVTTGNPAGIAVNSSGEAIFGGASVNELNATGSALVYSTPVFGGVAVVSADSTGAAYIAGLLIDSPGTFPLVQPIQGWGGGSFAAKYDSSGNLVWSTLLGVTSLQLFGSRIALDGNGNLYLATSDIGFPGMPGTIDPQLPLPPIQPSLLLKIAPSLGAPVPLVNPGAVSFPATLVGASSTAADITVGNYGDADLPAVNSVTISGPFSQTNTCTATVPGGKKCDVNVVFSPTSPGLQTGTLTVNFGGAFASQTVALSGTATAPAFSAAPSPVVFPPQAVGIPSAAQNFVITNTGTASLVISQMQASGDFSLGNTSPCAPPVSPGSKCTVQVTFTPTVMGSRTGALAITDNAPGSPHAVTLSGTGAAANLGLNVANGGSAVATVSAGSTASYALSVGGQGVSGTAALTCTGAPSGATCNVPGSISVSSTSAATFNASVTTTPRTTAALRPPGSGNPYWIWAAALAGILVLPWASRSTAPKRSRLYLATFSLLALAVLCSCGGSNHAGGGPTGTPAGTFTLTVTATSGSSSQSLNLTLTVQ